MKISVCFERLRKGIDLEAERDDSTATVKAKIQDARGVPPDQLRLSFKGKEMENAVHLSDLEINEGNVLIAQYFLEVSIRKALSGELFVLEVIPSMNVGQAKYWIEEKQNTGKPAEAYLRNQCDGKR